VTKKPAAEDSEKDLKEYAGRWMTERKGTDSPLFLKVAFAIIGLFGVGYLVVYRNGEVNHAERGVLVREFNLTSKPADTFMYLIAGLVLIFVCIVVTFAIRKFVEKD
jgi:hypothetical protein